jgi:hypothetical protein
MQNLLTQREIVPPGTFSGPGTGLLSNPGASAGTVFTNFLSSIIGLMTAIAGIWFIFLLVTGAISLMTSGGDKAQAETARKRITSGIVGLGVVVAAVFLADLIGSLLGLDILNPIEIIESF